jgi:hypothetical protein
MATGLRFCVVALALLAPFATAALSQACLDAAGANTPTLALANSVAAFTSIPNSQQGITLVWNVLQSVTTPYFQNLYFGLSNGDFFMLKNCRLQESTNIPYCGQANTPLIAYVRSSVDFGTNTQRHIFPVDANGILGAEITPAPSGTYDTVNRFWYTQPSGWSALQTFAAGGQGFTYTVGFNGVVNGGQQGVAAWDRVTRTPCDVCADNSFAVTAATVLAAMDMRRYVSVTSSGVFQELMWPLWQTLLATQRGNGHYTISTYVGLANSDFYQISDCWATTNAALPQCMLGTRYFATVRNTAIFGDQFRHVYSVNTDGSLILTPIVSGVYNTTQRPWFQLNNGWTDTYLSATSGLQIQSFTISFATGSYFATTNPLGVVVADTVPGGEPCVGWLYTCASTTPTATPTVTNSISVTPTPTIPAAPVLTANTGATRSLGYGLGLGLGFGLGLPLVLVTLGILYLIATRSSAPAAPSDPRRAAMADVELYGDADYDAGRKPAPATIN